ncbi:hypothetical protein HBH42_022670 [Parastagonospora nodorum]|nr:hypothetical protein HBH42_022670 [Parastagonospora nodorum]
MRRLIVFLSSLSTVSPFPWVPAQQGIDPEPLRLHRHDRRQAHCPFNANHEPAAPYNASFPYTGARNGLPGTGKGGIRVPAHGDTAHAFKAPTSKDIRGPCPGLNAAANHNFIARDGITTFNELMDAQQNLWNVNYDLALILAVFGVVQDGDIITGKLSIACDATSRTAALGGFNLLGRQPGLNSHSRFEADASLTRNDYFTHGGDNYSFNGTLFARMKEVADRVSGGNFDQKAMAAYRSQRYDESLAENGNFFWGPLAILLYGASSFVYELFAPYGGQADLASVSSFFGTTQDSNGQWQHTAERIPDGWHNRRYPYTTASGVEQILAQLLAYPKPFGGNIGPNNFNAVNFGVIRDGKLPDSATAGDILCLLYQLATSQVPNTLTGVLALPLNLVKWSASKLNPVFDNAGCALAPL